MKAKSYAQAGVDLGVAARVKERLAPLAAATYGPRVLAGVGPFAGLFELKGFREPVLVASADGVGTKLKLAAALDRYPSVGMDLVHHCVNDILTAGAQPLFLLDYIAMDRLHPDAIEALVAGIAGACRGVDCALLGGETAEMPGVYRQGEYDLVGFIVGAVEKDAIIDGRGIVPGDLVLGLPSSGLHTNGYSLVRKVFDLDRDPAPLKKPYPELGRTLGEALLEPHRCYLAELKPWLPRIKGMAHITGGGIAGNLVRILPHGTLARIRQDSWRVPALFRLIQGAGGVEAAEMFRAFNMGIGMCLVVSSADAPDLLRRLPSCLVIGEMEAGERRVIIEGGVAFDKGR